MRKEEERAAGSPRKAPRLELPDYARGGAASPGVSGGTEQEDGEQCSHYLAWADRIDSLLARIMRRERAPRCEHCWLESFERLGTASGGRKEDPRKRQREIPKGLMMVCLDCERCLCAGAGAETTDDKPWGHAWTHANKKSHWVALWFDQPDEGYCFLCGSGLYFYQEEEDVVMESAVEDRSGADVSSRPDSNELGYVVRGIPNLGNTCYINALVQCLLALGKLRVWMLGPDAPMGLLSMALKELFAETSTGKEYGLMMDPGKLLLSLGSLNAQYAQHTMEDSQELLLDLRNGLIGEEKLKWPPKMRDRVPTVVDSIFQGQTTTTLTCKSCQFVSLSHDSFSELTLPLASKGQATKSVASPQSDLEKAQIDAQGGDSKSVAEKAPEPLEADSTEAEQIQERKNAVHGTTEDKGKSLSTDIVCDEEDSNSLASIKNCLALYLKQDEIEWFCEPCSKARKEAGASFSEKDSASSSTENEETDRDGKADKKLDLPSVQDSQNASTPEDRRKQTDLNSAPQETENQNEQKDRKEDEDKTAVISKLPPVLTIHFKRFDRHSNVQVKITGHVSFEENFDVGQFMDPSSQDKVNSTYGLVGVVEHIGSDLKYGHYVAYVRGSRIGSHQQLSSGSSWFRADDKDIKEVSLEEVLKREAYLLFYERMED
ncbi:hypothetical protein ACP70R_003622 [Stipagrostis hirtigluma subsp. patula]